MHFRILRMIATSGFLAALECTKFVFGRGSTGKKGSEGEKGRGWGEGSALLNSLQALRLPFR